MKQLRALGRQVGALHATSAAMITVIALVAGIGASQLALTSNAKTTLDYAALLAARAGAVSHGDEEAIMEGLMRGLAPLYGSSSAPTGASPKGANGVDWVVPDPSSVDKFSESLMGGDGDFSADFEADVARTVRGDASLEAAVAAAESDLLGSAGGGMVGVAIINPVREVFTDFGTLNDEEGVLELPNKGIWRRTGNKINSTTSHVQVCTPVAEPYYEDPTAPPSFDEPSGETARKIFNAFTWNSDILEEEYYTNCRDDFLGCDAFGGENGYQKYVTQVSGPRGEAFGRDINAIIDRYIYGEIDAPTMYRQIRERGERMKAEFEAADIESVRYCKTRVFGICTSRRTFTPDSKDWGPMSRVDELIEAARMMENGTAHDPSPGSLSPGSFGTAIGDWRERARKDGSNTSAWDNFVGTKLEPLWKTWIEDPSVPMYKNFMEEASKAAKEFQGRSGLTQSQRRYLDYLQAVNGGVFEPDIDYIHSQNCESREVSGYVAPTVGAASDLNIQDANLLRIYVLYGHKPFFDLPESFYTAMGWTSRLTPIGQDAVPSSLRDEYAAIVAAGRIPLMATALVRMQSELRESPLQVSRNDPFFHWDGLGVE